MIIKTISLLILTAFALSTAGAEAATITVGPQEADYATIQGAIDAASPGDVVEVGGGTYRENVVVKIPIVLRAADGGGDKPIIDAGGRGSAVVLTADGVVLEGFILENGGFGRAGIEVRSKDNQIRKNLVTDNRWYGIYLDGSRGTVIEENVVWNNKYGIWINAGSDDNRIERNVFEANDNSNAFDLGRNLWEGNYYGDYDGSAPTYSIPGISGVDLSPSGPERVEEEETGEAVTVQEGLPHEVLDEAGEVAARDEALPSEEELAEDLAAGESIRTDPAGWRALSLADLALSLHRPLSGGGTDTERSGEEEASGPYCGDAVIDSEAGEVSGDESGEVADEVVEAVETVEETAPIPREEYTPRDWVALGDSLAAAGRYPEALASYERALEMDPAIAGAWVGRGDALTMTGSYDKAARSYDRALSIDPLTARTWYHKGNALQMLLRFEEALACYEEAVRIDPSFAEAWNRKGVIHNRLGRYQEALESFEKALALEPGYAAVWNSKSWAHQMLGEAQAAKEAYERARSLGYR
ncbi:MAG: TPR-repeat protein [Methanothrix sp.]|jgi:parallel beta-helix repeat protein|nr:MAG: TPR-repeat protein [Methanothrix sp.]